MKTPDLRNATRSLAAFVALGCSAAGCASEPSKPLDCQQGFHEEAGECVANSPGSFIANGASGSSMTTRWLWSSCATNGFVSVGQLGVAADGTSRIGDRAQPSIEIQTATWVDISTEAMLFSFSTGSGPLLLAGLQNIEGSVGNGSFTATIVNQDGTSLDGCVFNLIAGSIGPANP